MTDSLIDTLGPGDPAAPPRGPTRSRTLTAAAIACLSFFLLAVLLAAIVHPRIPRPLLAALVALPVGGVVFGLLARRTSRHGATRAAAREANSAVTLAAVALGLVVIVALLLPTLCRAREPANRAKCANNLRQIGQVLSMYAANHGGRFPPALDVLVADREWEVTAEVFVCPSSNDERATGDTPEAVARSLMFDPGHLSYVYVGGDMPPGPAVPGRVLAYDRPHNHNGDGVNVLYADGHVEFITKQDADRLVAELNAGHNPPRPRR